MVFPRGQGYVGPLSSPTTPPREPFLGGFHPPVNILGMKTAVSVPDDVFNRAELLAKQLKLNRSQLFSRALAEFVARHAPEEVTEALNRVCDELDDETDAFATRAAQRTFARHPVYYTHLTLPTSEIV